MASLSSGKSLASSSERGQSSRGIGFQLPSGPQFRVKVPPELGQYVELMSFYAMLYQPDDLDLHTFFASLFEGKLKQRKKAEKEKEEREKAKEKEVAQGIEQLLNNLHISKELADKYATKIEAAFKGHLTRKHFQTSGKTLHKEHQHSWESKRWGSEGSPKMTEEQLLEFLEALHLDAEEANRCALKIQAAFRGHKVRTSLEGEKVQKAIQNARRKSSRAKEEFKRLPKNAVPVHYSIKITPRLDTLEFDGTESIQISVSEESSEIVLNSLRLKILTAVCSTSTSKEQKAAEIVSDDEKEIIRLLFDPPIPEGNAILSITYKGQINKNLKGIYVTKRVHTNPETKNVKESFMIVTQLEATEARSIAPTWDEPEFKATFSISLVVEKNKTSISNMPLKEVTEYKDPEGGQESQLEIREYEKSPAMSTYLVAFCVGDFDFLEMKTSTGVTCRVYTPPGNKEQGRFALEVAVKILPIYAEYFDVPYPLPKLDLVAVPELACSAMENFGMLVFQDTAILMDNESSSQATKQFIAIVVCHEITHQWFGNITTMTDWSGLWLNEGFATFFEIFGADRLFPEFDLWTQFTMETIIPALEHDAFSSSHPVEVEIHNPNQIDDIFDAISYNKGGSIIRMLYISIGDEAFRQGMKNYLTKYKFKNADTENLWECLEEASGKPIGRIMSTWTKQKGFPLIRVRFEQIDGSKCLHLTQEKFWASPLSAANQSTQDFKWIIPLTLSSASNPSAVMANFLMEEKSVTMVLPDTIADDEWVKVNPFMTGFYRVSYPIETLRTFASAIYYKKLSSIDRLSLLDDLFALVKSGENSTADLLELLQAYKSDDDYSVWNTIDSILEQFNFLLENTPSHNHFKEFGRNLVLLIGNRMGWERADGESHLATMLRSLVLSLRINFDDKDTIEESHRRMKLHLSGEQTISPDLRSIVYPSVLSSPQVGVDVEREVETFISLYKSAEFSEEKQRIGQALGAVRDPTLLKKVLEFSVSPDVMIGDTTLIVVSVSVFSAVGRRLAWNFIKENVELFRIRYSSGGMLNQLFKHCTENFQTKEDAVDVENFFKINSFPEVERDVQQALENIRVNVAWLERDKVEIGDYLSYWSKKANEKK